MKKHQNLMSVIAATLVVSSLFLTTAVVSPRRAQAGVAGIVALAGASTAAPRSRHWRSHTGSRYRGGRGQTAYFSGGASTSLSIMLACVLSSLEFLV